MIRCPSRTKWRNPNIPRMVPCWICVTITSRFRKLLHPNQKGNPFYSFWYLEISWISLWRQIGHQTLKSIFSKSIVSCPPCIRKFFLRLQKYEFDLKYSPENAILVSDALIQAYIKNSKPEFDENNLIHHVHFVISNLPINNERLE